MNMIRRLSIGFVLLFCFKQLAFAKIDFSGHFLFEREFDVRHLFERLDGKEGKEDEEIKESVEEKDNSSLSSPFNSSKSSYSSSSLHSSSSSNSSLSSSSSQSSYAHAVLITEVLANPIGSDDSEWIEIGNLGSSPIDIVGWILRDATGKYKISPRNGSGFVLAPYEHIVFDKSRTGLSLRNAGEEVSLYDGEMRIDGFAYPETAEEVSYGRDSSGQLMPFCIPTPNAANSIEPIRPRIERQEGRVSGQEKVSINLKATIDQGSMKHASCQWNYGDGYTSDSCNPPSHTFDEVGSFTITLRMSNYCGTVGMDSIKVKVLPSEEKKEGKDGKEGKEGKKIESCVPSTMTGVLISEFLPNPIGDDAQGEWIELHNPTTRTISLCEWKIDDGEEGSTPFALDEYSIGSGSFLVLPRSVTKIAINNSDERVRLFFLDDLVHEVMYEDSFEGESFAHSASGKFLWTSILTPGEENVFTVLEKESARMNIRSDGQSSSSSSTARVLSEQVKQEVKKETSSPSLTPSRYRNIVEKEEEEIVVSDLLLRVKKRAREQSTIPVVENVEKMAYKSTEKAILSLFLIGSCGVLYWWIKVRDLGIYKPRD